MGGDFFFFFCGFAHERSELDSVLAWEVTEDKLHLDQKKNAPIKIVCGLLKISHSMSTCHSMLHAFLSCW